MPPTRCRGLRDPAQVWRPFWALLDGNVFLLPILLSCSLSFSLAVYPSLLQSILLFYSLSFSYAVHPIFCSCEELLHPLTIVGLRLLRPFPLRA
jgi:hypothetical protein